MINHHGSWLLSVKIGVPLIMFFGIIALVTFLFATRGFFATEKNDTSYDDTDHFDAFMTMLVSGIVFLCLTIIPAFCYYPFHGDYHRLQPISGTITSIDSRYLATSQYLVMTFDSGLTVRCDDSRCVTVHNGDDLRLLCTKEHSGGSPLETDGWGCRWGE